MNDKDKILDFVKKLYQEILKEKELNLAEKTEVVGSLYSSFMSYLIFRGLPLEMIKEMHDSLISDIIQKGFENEILKDFMIKFLKLGEKDE